MNTRLTWTELLLGGVTLVAEAAGLWLAVSLLPAWLLWWLGGMVVGAAAFWLSLAVPAAVGGRNG